MEKWIHIAGVDEAGRGPLAGPVYAAAVILNKSEPIDGLADSKILSEKKREGLFELIKEKALAYAIAKASVEEIEEMNILQATLLAMRRAIESLAITPCLIRVDGKQAPPMNRVFETIIDGDATVAEISAASILAKVSRDREMLEWHDIYPHYGFNQHKGYGTAKHMESLRKLGACPIHRKTFAPVQAVMNKEEII